MIAHAARQRASAQPPVEVSQRPGNSGKPGSRTFHISGRKRYADTSPVQQLEVGRKNPRKRAHPRIMNSQGRARGELSQVALWVQSPESLARIQAGHIPD